ncbi:SLAP domain-containing protein [Companilactobacillus zhachilii]|uniref:SLAP domain-containing protein n=1 Tax=Companilactobacillus zhachilii TaxID=2304606 RepID=UPI001923A818|nr:SLAP domain-containing protein [Companilactobacillus zhachilii]MBL3530931.1 SLAP domain-containing protein [Companilactobacillus zhachilii]
MKKYKKMVLAGILLSSTILGANTSVVQAASTSTTNSPLTVDKSLLTNAIQVINELLDSKTTANKVNAQTKFSDLVDKETTLTAAPIFGKKSSTEFTKALQGELNVVNDSGQLVPMTIGDTDSHGFAKTVTYTTSNNKTKTVNVKYNLTMPTVSFSKGTTMNFTSANEANESISNLIGNNSSKIVTAKTTNGDDANGNTNAAKLSANPVSITASGDIEFTPSDIYGNGIPATGTVNLYSAPTVPDRKSVTSTTIKNPFVFTDANSGQKFSATTTDTPAASVNPVSVNYNITAIDSMGNTVNDSATGEAITYSGKGNVTVTDNSDTAINYMIVFKDANTGNTVYTMDKSGEVGETIDKDVANGTGYTFSGDQTQKIAADTTEMDFKVTKDANTTVNYISIITGKPVGTDTLKGNNGSSTILNSIPKGYQLVNVGDFAQKLNADQPNKDIYVKPIQTTVGNLSYTVTFRDKTTGKQVGTQVKSEGALGDYIGLTAPDGYAFASVLDNGFLLLKNNQNVTKYVVAADTPYNISYVDQDTGKEVGTQTGKGADGSKIVLKAPTGYAFVSADDINYKIDKDTPKSTVYVQKSDQTEDNIVSGYPKNGYIKIYDKSGKLNNDVVLSEGSSWIIDQSLTINGVEYYRVATNEYVKASDVYKYTPLQTVATTNGTNLTPVYNSRGQVIIDRALDTNTPWYTDRSATIRGQKMYRVATDEWIKASDSTLK